MSDSLVNSQREALRQAWDWLILDFQANGYSIDSPSDSMPMHFSLLRYDLRRLLLYSLGLITEPEFLEVF